MTELTTAVCSIALTKRKRFFWAAWWTGAPTATPFRHPDAANGGATTWQAALEEAQAAAGRHLVVIESYWARAFMCVLRGQPIPARPATRARKPEPKAVQHAQSSWSVLGLEPGASAIAVRRAFRQRALETHPDRGGDAEQFRAVMRAYERLRDEGKRPKPRRRTER